MPYDPFMVQPMRDELTRIGVEELKTAPEVDAFMANRTGTAMIVVNSVCGCAAGSARPGVGLALQHPNRPDRIATVFAGQDLEAVQQARSYFAEFPPSSPSVVLFSQGKPVDYVSRQMIEGRDPQTVSQILIAAFEKHIAKVAAPERK
jgi:putative YphP/YqiW family bacilliredoxin